MADLTKLAAAPVTEQDTKTAAVALFEVNSNLLLVQVTNKSLSMANSASKIMIRGIRMFGEY